MSTIKTKNVQVGTDGTASNNFTIYVPGTPDGTVRIGNGDAGSVTDAVTINSSGAVTLANNLTVTGTASINGSNTSPQPSFRNRIINGAMVIDQRNAGASQTPTDGQYTVDRWQIWCDAASKLTTQQSTTVPTGYKNSLLITSSSAYSITSTQQFGLLQPIEGLNTYDLNWGSANAKTVTLSFWVRSSLTGTFGGAIRNSAGDRFYIFSYTISSANTWEQKTVTITGDTSGTWLTTNGKGLYVYFSLGAGSSKVTTAGSWGSTAYYGVTGQQNLVSTSGATLYITGVQLEVGSTATDFEVLPYDVELARCQRYFETSFAYGQAVPTSTFDGMVAPGYNQASSTTGEIGGQVNFQTKKRATPTVTIYDQSSNSGKLCRTLIGVGNYDNQTSSIANFNDRGGLVYGSGNNASYVRFHFKAEAEL